jgi:hypothetical protein
MTTQLEPSVATPRLDLEAVVAESLRDLPAPPAPQWEAVARDLVAAGCPFLALAVAETRLEPQVRQPIVKSALAAVARGQSQRAAARLASQTSGRVTAALRKGDLDLAASILARYERHPARQAATVRTLRKALAAARERAAGEEPTAPVGTDEEAAARYSCQRLCSLHMVELCNNDKVLWSAHRVKWEATVCGERREEPFLQDCYRRQWLSGTFRDGCLRPCEGTAGGRDQLLMILKQAGCVRLDPS